ncbi:hypothetical protein BDF21DRAFT_455741 [Thamnidium elegans]|nr:hypothetical protein BDF21DRAFT_455741 [Thamnidium elegans]
MAFPTSYQLYTVSITLKSFIRQDEGNPNKLLEYQERIITQSSFLREVVYKAQLLVNYYILNNANNNVEYLSNDIFEKNFWYRVCRLIYGKITIEELQNFYPRLPGIQEAYNHLQALENVNLLVEREGLVGYGQIVSSACDTVATAYNNFYVENYETYIGNYFIYRLKQEYTNIKMPLVKKVVYDYVLDEVLKNDTRSDMPEGFITQDGLNSAPNLQAFLNNIIQPVRNRAPRLPLSREEVTKNPFIVLSIMTYIIEFYEQVNIQLQENAQPEQSEELLEQTTEQPPAQTVELVRPQIQMRQPQRPRLFSLFPNPSLKWRFIKIDGQNLSTLFPDTRLQKEENETNFALATRCFFNSFDFTKLKIRNLTKLQELPRQKRRMFLNSIYTDGYTCRISFARSVPETLEEDKVNLEIADFNADEIENFFRPCFLDPGRKNAYVAYYGNEQVRSLTVNEYYCSSGPVNRARKQDTFKIEQGIKALETQIPTTKTSSVDSYINHLTYVLTHLRRFFFNFYDFRTASIKWNNYYGRQCALEEACNILINGGKKI